MSNDEEDWKEEMRAVEVRNIAGRGGRKQVEGCLLEWQTLLLYLHKNL